MRTNIVLEDKLIERAQELSGIKTRRALINEALRLFIQVREQAEVCSLRGKLKWEGNMDDQRQARFLGK